MITRGYYLGEIIDDFSVLSSQVKMRNKLGFTDLSVFAENFMRDVLGVLLNIKLENLNSERSNEPGLDLGSIKNEIAFQITSSATSEKINSTLQKITEDQKNTYKKIIVFGMGGKQGKYTLDVTLTCLYDFKDENIWDFNTIARKSVDLEIDKLQELYEMIQKNSARLKVELEIPDENGKYPTSNYEQWEFKPKPTLGSGEKYKDFYNEYYNEYLDSEKIKDLKSSLEVLGRKLSELPRVSREFLAMLYERREERESCRFSAGNGWQHLIFGKVKREYNGSDLDGEIDILIDAGFIFFDADDVTEKGPPEIGLKIPVTSDELQISFVDFIVMKELSFRKVIGEIDLSSF